jgi:hypothetical protein
LFIKRWFTTTINGFPSSSASRQLPAPACEITKEAAFMFEDMLAFKLKHEIFMEVFVV